MKANSRIIRREKGTKLNLKGIHDDAVDEIALRDEILELKRQVVILKRTNEQNLIKFRKYEDEAKRKDRQIEELMDPRKNAEITKLLSVKGAAILMNLKDQNNSLIQMILNKDLQIRRLVAEVKTSKLYGSSRKTENYRTEINRLRNLLEKSKESIKESIDLHQQQQQQQNEQQKLICINEISNMQTSSSSEQSSPRELEDLRFTIQSLETHIKYSNDLLAKKNLEILTLHDELNSMRKFSQCRTCQKIAKSNHVTGDNLRFIEKIEGLELPNSCRLKNMMKSDKITFSSGNLIAEEQFSDLFEKTVRLGENKKKSNSAPASSLRWSSFSDRSFPHEYDVKNDCESEKREERKSEDVFPRKSNSIGNSEEKIQDGMLCETSPQEDGSVNGIQKEEKKSRKREKEKWINSFMFKQFKRKSARKNIALHKRSRKKINKKNEEISDLEFEKMKKGIEENHEENGKTLKARELKEMNCSTFIKPGKTKQKLQIDSDRMDHVKREKLKENTCPNSSGNLQMSENNRKNSAEACQIRGEHVDSTNGREKIEKTEKEAETETEHSTDDSTRFIKNEIANISSNFSPEIQRELKNLYENITIYEEIEKKKVKSRREIYEQNFDSSFDSDNGYHSKQEPLSVRVEVEINSLPFPHENFQSEESPSTNSKCSARSVFNRAVEDNDFPDDDDVIVRHKIF